MFITFEGVDGCGKTTQLELLRAHLESEFARTTSSTRIVTTREPGGTKLAETAREIILHSQTPLSPRAELLLFGAARAQHVDELITPALNQGDWVLCDRFVDSTLAYQGGGLGLDAEFIRMQNDYATNGLTPHLTLLFDVDVRVALERRAAQRGEDRIEERGLQFQERVRAGFLELAKNEPQRIQIIDANAPAKVIHNRVVRVLEEQKLWPK
jgi:dTMP kinase